jgi:multiple sugar transport system ATP-binding protein
MIAGLEDISEGELRIDGEVVNSKAPKDRDIAMVFQNYALYPHMTVRENMGFPLKLAKVDKATINSKVEDAARILELTQHLDRKPSNLSGGQRQRVAMGRAIVRDPKAFLMDEPLSNLDAKLRVQMRTQVSRLQRQLGTTMIYVTHDQTEAMTLGDRIVVMRGGIVQQIGSSEELYNGPVNLFVAGFIGSPAMNFLPATLQDGQLQTSIGPVPLMPEYKRAIESRNLDREVIVGIRPEHFEDARLVESGREGTTFTAATDVVESLGSDIFAYFTIEGGRANAAELEELARDSGSADTASDAEHLVTRLDPASRVREGQDMTVWFDPARIHVFDPSSGENVTVGARSQ